MSKRRRKRGSATDDASSPSEAAPNDAEASADDAAEQVEDGASADAEAPKEAPETEEAAEAPEGDAEDASDSAPAEGDAPAKASAWPEALSFTGARRHFRSPFEGKSLGERIPLLWKTWEGRGLLASVLIPLVYYTAFISVDFTFGDGPEILTAVLLQGVIHPSGYPLYTILGQLFAHLPGLSPHWWLTFGLSTLPGVITSGVIYASVRRLGGSAFVGIAAALAFAFNDTSIMLGSRIEVYALSGMFVSLSLYWLIRFHEDRERFMWACLSTMSLALALCVHLTSAFLIPAVALALVLINWRMILNPKRLGLLFGIGLLCGMIYLYFPIASNANNDGSAVLWNEPNTLDRFWYHVRGAEYDGFRKPKKFWSKFQGFVHVPRRMLFSGVLLVAILGLVETLKHWWRFVVPAALFVLGLVAYTSVYDIGDINTYYGPIFSTGLLLVAMGIDWLLKVRLPESWKRNPKVLIVVLSLVLSVPATLAWRNRGRYWQDILAESMSDDTVANLPEKIIFFTSVDGHTFPMWYQAYVKHPEKKIVTIDRVMFWGDDKLWYRNFLRRRHPEVRWPTEKEVKNTVGVPWEKWIIDHNKETHTFAALLAKPWNIRGSYPVNNGWYHDLVVSDDPREKRKKGTKYNMHIYMADHHRVGRKDFFSDSKNTYKVGEFRVACVTEWWKHDKKLNTRWQIRGPENKVINYKPHPVPANSNLSWEYLEIKDQVPGEWECEVKVNGGEEVLIKKFTLVP